MLNTEEIKKIKCKHNTEISEMLGCTKCLEEKKGCSTSIDTPMGVSKWIEHGKKYGYTDFFLSQQLSKQREEIEKIFEKYYPPIKCVGRAIRDDGVCQTYMCLHYCKNEWSEAENTPICPLSFDPIAHRVKEEVISLLDTAKSESEGKEK